MLRFTACVGGAGLGRQRKLQVRVPDTVEPGLFQPVVLHVGNTFSQPGVGLTIQ